MVMAPFNLVNSSKTGSIPVRKYKSNLSGLTVVIGEVEGPLVHGYFVLATEAHDDDGLPHTLEHLIFLGSEKYPYKGILDLLANRCLASGTNAWTDTDHTCYTMTTAGKGGFLQLLPIYLDHILYPTLSDKGFITEVHHVTEDGEDGGVVYCEMQGRENTGESLACLNLMRAIYPNCGYSSETGGIMHNLRTSTTNEKVRDYHKKFYRPENLTIIIAGQIGIDDVAIALEPIQEKILSMPPKEPFVQPWQTPVEKLHNSNNIKILYPADEEVTGIVHIGWRGPRAVTEFTKLASFDVLLRYLADTSASPLYQEFVECDDACAGSVSYNICENWESLIYLSFEHVPIGKLDVISGKLQILLQKMASGEVKIDLKRINNIIERNIIEANNSLETHPQDTIAFTVIGDVLFGNSDESFSLRLNNVKTLESLRNEDINFWITLIDQYLVKGYHIVIRAAPSIEEQNRLSRNEIERIEKQCKDLGEEGLRIKGEELFQASIHLPPPDEMLTQVPIQSTDDIYFHPVSVFRPHTVDNIVYGLDLNKFPVYTEAYNLHTNFIYIIATLNTTNVTTELRPYLLLFMELLTQSPIRHENTIIPYEEVVAALESDTITMGTRLGLESNDMFSCGIFSNTASLLLQVETRKYDVGVNWVYDLLHNVEFNADRVRICATKIVGAVAQAKCQGNSVAKDILKAIYYKKDTNVRVTSMLSQQKFLTSLLVRLEDNNSANAVINELNELRTILINPQNIGIHLAADWKKIIEEQNIDMINPWVKLFIPNPSHVRELPVVYDYELMSFVNNFGANNTNGTVVGLGGVESAFLYQATTCINNFMDPDLPVLLLFLQYLTQLEGPLWRQIRGQGYAYGYSLVPKPHEGLLYLTFYRATNVIAAYKDVKAITEAQILENAIWDQALLESARSSLIFEIIEREKNVGEVVVQSLLSSFKKVPISYNRTLVQRVNSVTESDLHHVGNKYVSKLFSGEAKTVIVCHPQKAKDISESFKACIFQITP